MKVRPARRLVIPPLSGRETSMALLRKVAELSMNHHPLILLLCLLTTAWITK